MTVLGHHRHPSWSRTIHQRIDDDSDDEPEKEELNTIDLFLVIISDHVILDVFFAFSKLSFLIR